MIDQTDRYGYSVEIQPGFGACPGQGAIGHRVEVADVAVGGGTWRRARPGSAYPVQLLVNGGDVGLDGVTVEVLATAVVERGGSGIGVTDCQLDIPQRDAGVEGVCGDRSDAAVRGAWIEPPPIVASQDRPGGALADGQSRGCGRGAAPTAPWWAGVLAHDARCAIAFEPEMFDVGVARLTDP